MKNLILVLLCSIPFISSTQIDVKLQYGPSASFDWSYRTLTLDSDEFGIGESIIDFRNEIEKSAPRATAGIDFGLLLGDHFTVETGMQYSNKGYRSQNNFTLVTHENDNGTIVTNVVSAEVKSWINYHYIDIPITVGYQFKLGKQNGLKMQLGYINNFYITSSFRTIWDWGHTKQIDYDTARQLSNYSGQGMAGVYFQWRPGQMKTAIEFGPQFKFSTLPIIEAPIHERLYSAGIRAAWYLR